MGRTATKPGDVKESLTQHSLNILLFQGKRQSYREELLNARVVNAWYKYK